MTTSPVMRARRGTPPTNLMWAELTRILGVDDLAALLGIGQNTLRRYVAGSENTPADIVGRLDYLRRLLYDLGRSYNESGMRRWFWRHRPALDGKCPGALLSGDWDPNGAAAQQVRLLAVS